MKNPLFLINKRFNSLRKSEKLVAEYVQKHMDEVILLSLQALATKCGTSDATVLRFCRSLGYLGFADFKISLVPELLSKGRAAYVELKNNSPNNSVGKILEQNFRLQVDSALVNIDNEILSLIAQHISRANKIIIIGLGGSAGVAHIFCDSLGSLGILSHCLQDRSIIQNVVPLLNSGDIVIGISHTGETEEVVSAINSAKEYGAHTVCITNFSPSPLADISELPLITGVPSNLLGSYSCQARICQLVILELILYELSKLVMPENVNHGKYSKNLN